MSQAHRTKQLHYLVQISKNATHIVFVTSFYRLPYAADSFRKQCIRFILDSNYLRFDFIIFPQKKPLEM